MLSFHRSGGLDGIARNQTEQDVLNSFGLGSNFVEYH